jgi:hypothetical protein
MTNDEARMTIEEAMTNDESRLRPGAAGLQDAYPSFVIGFSSFLRHSDFVIHHCAASRQADLVR